MKIVFLDIDGVLNSFDDPSSAPDLNPKLVKLLNQLVDDNTRFVISSSWRYHHGLWEFQHEFRAAGFEGKIIDATTCIKTKLDGTTIFRGEQILIWVKSHREHIDSYVVFDDYSTLDCPEVEKYWVKIHNSAGITQEHIDKAKTILNHEKV